MRFLIVLCALLALASADFSEEQKARHDEDIKQCTQQVGITREQATAMRDGHFEDVDAKSKCFAKCVLEKMGVLANDKLVDEKVLEILGPIDGVEKTKNLINTCGPMKGSDKCDTGYLLYECFHKNRLA